MAISRSIKSFNDGAAAATWLALRSLKQFHPEPSFQTFQTVRISDLTFWSGTVSSATDKVEAQALADHFDGICRKVLGAQHKPTIIFSIAVEEMVSVLIEPSMTVADFVKKVDKLYVFDG